MAFFNAPGFAMNVNHDVISAGAGVGIGAIQIIATQTMDASGSLGAPVVAGMSNGQLINVVTGVPTLIAGAWGAIKESSRIGRHRSATAALLGYGATTLLAGVVVPQVVAALAPGGVGARGAHGARAASGTGFTTSNQRTNSPAANLAPASRSNWALSSALNS